jgi:ABC-type cobalamin/Fe3+-siderophores transport system ATPase subunit
MVPERHDELVRLYAGEWIAISQGQVVAHGLCFEQVAKEACKKALDISFQRIPDPRAPRWQARSGMRVPRRRPLLTDHAPAGNPMPLTPRP